MREKILTILKAHKGRAGYYGIVPDQLVRELDWSPTLQSKIWDKRIDMLMSQCRELHQEKKLILTVSSSAADKGNVVLITYREDV